MDEALRFVLDGLENYLELERELGLRTLEVDRTLLSVSHPKSDVRPAPAVKETPPPAPQKETVKVASSGDKLDFVFIHDRPLSPKAVEMMSKIIPAMGKTAETAPIVIAPPIPNARCFVFLGRAALAKYMPGLRGEENRWLKSPKGKDVLLVKSPEEIVRFSTVTPALKKVKMDMWMALKTVMQHVRIGN